MSNFVVKPVGKLLQQAGLVSATAIEIALRKQTKGDSRRLGEILAWHGWIKQETVDFFVEQWPKIFDQQRLLGEYLQAAGLLNQTQVEAILAEQKQTGLKFGEVAILKRWLRKTTLDFFLEFTTHQAQATTSEETLAHWQTAELEPPRIVEGDRPNGANQEELLPEMPKPSPDWLLEQILLWTNRQPFLTEKLYQLVAEEPTLTVEQAAVTIEQIVETRLLKRPSREVFQHYQQKRDRLIADSDQKTLKLYQQVLRQETIAADSSPEQQQLLDLELVAIRQGNLVVHNPIYKRVFNLDWVERELTRLSQPSTAQENANQTNRQAEESIPATDAQEQPTIANIEAAQGSEPNQTLMGEWFIDQRRPSKLSIWGGLTALGLLIGLASYQAVKLTQSNSLLLSEQEESLPEICQQYFQDRKEQIDQLRDLHQQTDAFSPQCQRLKDELLFGYAIETLASNNLRQEAVTFLCEVTDSYYQNQSNLPPYFRRWSESSTSFRVWLEVYLQNNACAAANYLL